MIEYPALVHLQKGLLGHIGRCLEQQQQIVRGREFGSPSKAAILTVKGLPECCHGLLNRSAAGTLPGAVRAAKMCGYLIARFEQTPFILGPPIGDGLQNR